MWRASASRHHSERDPPNERRESGRDFDKDDKVAMRFVTAAANLRGRVFHIAPQSFHDCKGIAGNIIPAIATTNAIVAGLQTAELTKLLDAMEVGARDPVRNRTSPCRHTYIHRSESCMRKSKSRVVYTYPVD